MNLSGLDGSRWAPPAQEARNRKTTIQWPTCFHRGDPNSDGDTDVSDAIATFGYLFGDKALTCLDSADSNGDGATELSDGIFLINFIFLDGKDPPAPGPTAMDCGTNDPLQTEVQGCDSYDPCFGS